MSLRFQYLCTIFGHILYAVNCCVSLQINSQPVNDILHGDDLLKSAVNKVELLSLKLERYNLHMQSELMAMKEQLLREIKEIKKNQESVPPATKKPASCTEAMRQENGKYEESGVYELYLPEFLQHPFNVYCLRDPDGGEPWSIIQRRQSNDTDFYRGWIEYEHGFGDLNANFFLGLDKIHALTHSRSHELWIQLEDFANEKSVAKYESFAIGNAQDKYELIALGQYSGTAGDSFSDHLGEKFTTKDSDNDKYSGNCAIYSKGAWWYNSCYDSNLNGLYLGGEYPKSQEGRGVDWDSWYGNYYSLKYVHMAIRPKYYH
ncbi:fibrinogen C domain-containing protein 1-like isoform X4 [Bactrocera dorsalis]|uniref:Fibrinogen C domain-containing protein 1-like isoform X3 n=2 Tax=Bactrocera dorsalis TaxID=27457 RepID=A0ABM3IZF4_BACDO|nr:fibrinogen C domain-containing protein 1-like isoform X3 [Bactrocera dorsalis]XP_049302348.1 fibrinogen C domain-containing protein 1-like isoform X4 [Bactrocera dorsalis]